MFPFIATRLARAGGLTSPPVAAERPGWRNTRSVQIAALGALVALAGAFAAAVFPMFLLAALSGPGSLLVGVAGGTWRLVVTALEAVGVALVLIAPWAIRTALAGRSAVSVFGLPGAAANAPDWGEVIRFAIGPEARSPLVWLVVAAVALPLAIAQGPG